VAVVWVPQLLRPLAGGAEQVRVAGATLREVIDNLDAQNPGMRDRILDGGMIRDEIALAIGSNQATDLAAPVAPDDEVHILPAIAGGSIKVSH
jgi:molybdopterin converting factor small subunit